MSTNACIAVSNSHHEMKLEAIYCHWDGGKELADTLNEHFNTWELARELVGGGDVSSVSGDHVESYQDRGESIEKTKATVGDINHILCSMSTVEYFHIFHDGEWEFLTREEVREIEAQLEEMH
jgi:hypothetical protein